MRAMSWYEKRWCVEELLRLLKTGVRTEGRRLLDAPSAGRAVAVYTVTACHLFELREAAGTDPPSPAACSARASLTA